MVDTTLPRHRQAARRAYTVQRLTDAGEIRELLAPERAYAAYALAQLEPRFFPLSEWYTAAGPAGRAVLVHSRSGLGHALFAVGEAEALNAVLSLHPGPRFTFGSLRPEHRAVVRRYFILGREQMMLRMAVSAQRFTPLAGEAVRLRGRDIAAINRLYSTEGGASHYLARHIEEGVYYGARVDRRLVSIAGTHVVSPSEGLAVVGNVFTHPDYRDRGLAAVVTTAVTQELLARCPLLVLTVEADNGPAVRVYRRLGYQPECTLHETPLIRRDPVGGLSLARRLVAAWRGRLEGTEVVVR